MKLSHFATMLLFALFVSVALACLTQRSASTWIKYIILSFMLFIVISIAVAWLMYPVSR